MNIAETKTNIDNLESNRRMINFDKLKLSVVA